MSNPLFSIVTVNYNDAEGLERTIKSVLQQDFTNYEHIIIDGASTDTSVNIIKQYQPLYPQGVLTWLSESDGGIYHAMNKGIVLAKGTWLNMMNAGDWFDSHALSTVTTYINQNPQAQVFISPIRRHALKKSGSLEPYTEVSYYPSNLPEKALHHQGMFYHKNLHTLYGPYREDLRTMSDYAFELDVLYKNSTPFTVVSQCFINFTDGGSGSNYQSWVEAQQLRKQYGLPIPYSAIFNLLKWMIKHRLTPKQPSRHLR